KRLPSSKKLCYSSAPVAEHAAKREVSELKSDCDGGVEVVVFGSRFGGLEAVLFEEVFRRV
ncbi:hypothetical protein, partial [Herminiimonas sp. KBW02]|uniref:hypothetical protein n=1 Tax=Herminiimonas sp. KBW02 TaxID=2153363 RepID=UPI001F40D437